MSRRCALTDKPWEQIQDLLPGRAGHVGAPAKNNRLFVGAVLYCYRAGMAWCDLLERLKQYRTIVTHYDKAAAAFLGAIHLAAAVVWLI